ncbi:hypothetical protein ZWY2020_037950 [Hordeum vulgare]|nr:hypothetical protein ZWY2020_037950 [Hordeum vulgare]
MARCLLDPELLGLSRRAKTSTLARACGGSGLMSSAAQGPRSAVWGSGLTSSADLGPHPVGIMARTRWASRTWWVSWPSCPSASPPTAATSTVSTSSSLTTPPSSMPAGWGANQTVQSVPVHPLLTPRLLPWLHGGRRCRPASSCSCCLRSCCRRARTSHADDDPEPEASSAVFQIYGNVYPHGLYYVAMSIGNSAKPYFLDIDTSSDLPWLSCDAPCVSCSKVVLLKEIKDG